MKYIMLHHTASTASAIANAKFLANNPAPSSCNYVVGDTGYIWKIASDDQCTYHAGRGS